MIYEQIKLRAVEDVPFARLTGVEVVHVERGLSRAQLKERRDVTNHVGTIHAAALFALGEATSGSAMAGTLAPVLLGVKAVVAEASIRYVKPANGVITATGKVDGEPDRIVEELKANGKVRFDLTVTFHDATETAVCEMKVQWRVKMNG